MALPADGDVPLILSRIRAGADWGWSGGALNDPANVVWRDLVQFEPTQQEYDDEWVVILAEEASTTTTIQALKANINAVQGLAPSALSNAQNAQMIEVFIAVFGGLDFITRTIKPANQWDAAREIAGI